MKDQKFLELIKDSKTVLIIASRPLDFDCLGSGLILKKYLESLGKKVRLLYPAVITQEEKEFHNILPYFEEIENLDTREILAKRNFDVLILIDGMNLVQFYDSKNSADNPPELGIYDKRIHIDHHLQYLEKLGTYDICNPKASSTAEIILTKIIPEEFLDEKIATLGYLALLGDTGNFRWNFSSVTLELAAKLLAKGANPAEGLDKLFFSKTKEYLSMLKLAIENLEYVDSVRTVFLCVPHEKYRSLDLDDTKMCDLKHAFLGDVAKVVEGYDRGILLYEDKPGWIQINSRGSSLRNKVNLPKLFMELGGNGGGHFHATGIEIEGDFEKVKQILIDLLIRWVKF